MNFQTGLNWSAFNNATLVGMVAGCRKVYGDAYPAGKPLADLNTFNMGLNAEAQLIERVGVEIATRLVNIALTHPAR